MIFDGLDHMIFSSHVLTEKAKEKNSSAAAFWDAHLRGDADAKTWLEQGGFAAFIGSAGTFELRSPK